MSDLLEIGSSKLDFSRLPTFSVFFWAAHSSILGCKHSIYFDEPYYTVMSNSFYPAQFSWSSLRAENLSDH